MLPIDAPYNKEPEEPAMTKKQFKLLIIVPTILILLITLIYVGWVGFQINKEGALLQEQGGYYTTEGWKNLPKK